MKKRRLIPLYLASLAAALVIAGLAAADAAATNLCSEAPNAANECPAGKAYGVLQKFEWKSVNAHLETGLGQIACGESEATFELTAIAVASATVSLKALTFKNCKIGVKACPVTAVGLPYTAKVTTFGAGTGEMDVEGAGGAETKLKAECPGPVTCFFEDFWEPRVFGGNPATWEFREPEFSAACGESEFIATYAALGPKPVWVTK